MKFEGIYQYHTGDVIMSIQAQVNGGIGPQRTAESLIVRAR